MKSTKSWFVINPRARTKEELDHPAKYPDELAMRFVQFFTRPKEWVLDPFAGVGSTLVGCASLGRSSVGIELCEQFVDAGRKRLPQQNGDSEAHLIAGDSHRLVEVLDDYFDGKTPGFSYLITSPPYYDMLRKSRGGNDSVHKERLTKGFKQYYSYSDRDIGNITDYDKYIESVGMIIDSAFRLLRPSSYVTVIVQNMRDVDGTMKPIAWDLARRLSIRYELKQEQIWCQDNKRLGCWGYPSTYVSNVHHHYCLILQKRK